MAPEEILVASVRGTCAGVDRALSAMEYALEKYGIVYATHEPVHNALVSQDLQSRGLIFVNNVLEIPRGSAVVFSAHGTEKHVIEQAVERGLIVVDAACPLVTKVHREALRHENNGRKIIVVGNADHQEIKGLVGQVTKPHNIFIIKTIKDILSLPIGAHEPVAYVTQTTLNIDDVKDIITALEDKFDDIVGPGTQDVCFATKNRQDAVRNLCKFADVVVVIGSKNSSNSNHLRETAQQCGVEAHLLDDFSGIDLRTFFGGHLIIGITAGASVTNRILNHAIKSLMGAFPGVTVKNMSGITENVVFAPPVEVFSG